MVSTALAILESMFDQQRTAATAAPSYDELSGLLSRLAAVPDDCPDEPAIIDRLRAMEKLKGGLAAAQARLTARLDEERRVDEAERGVPADRRGRGLAAEVALARQESPHKGGRHLGLAKALVHEMPNTLAALTQGEISEWRATLIVQETAVLSREHRQQVDAELAGKLADQGDRRVAAEARKIGYRLDPGSAIRRTRGAEKDRRVGLRPAPDTMSYLTGFLPVAQGVACYAALTKQADALRAQGDSRSRGQIMADLLVERITGQSTDEGPDVEVELVMTDTALFGGDHSPGHVAGFGPVPAALGRQIVRKAHRAWLRRLFTQPGSHQLAAIDKKRRSFEGPLRQLIVARDRICRTPWCDAPVRHVDHVTAYAEGGKSTVDNGAGLCEACNYTKESAGWHARPGRDRLGRHIIDLVTPTGHRYRSTAPTPDGAPPTFVAEYTQAA